MSNDARRGKRLFAGFLAAVMALSVAPVLGFTGVAGADDHVADPTGEGNFCEDVPMQEPFTDVTEADPSYGEIVCLVATEVTTGVTATTYEPNSFVTRRQMALFLTRVAAEANRLEVDDNINELPEPAANEFDDVEDEEQFIQDAISQVAQAEIAQGFPDGDYRPAAPVSRRQMAAFIDRLYEYLTGDELPATDDYFADDDEDSAEAQASTNAVAEAGIFIGNEDGTFAPAQEITRRQMANVLTRTFQVLFENGEIEQWSEDEDGPEPIGPNPTFTDAPELVQVSNVEANVVAFEFDETITGQALKFTGTSPNRQYYSFRMYNPTGNVSYPLEARIEGDSVIARFAPNVVNQASLATVRYDAVEDVTGTPNIEGEYPLVPPVVTSATAPFSPQLVRVDNYRTADVITGGTAELLIDYTFNAAGAGATLGLLDGTPPTPILNPTGDDANDFYLVGQFGGEFQADSIQNVQTTAATATDPGQTVITVSFSVNPTEVPESQLRRGYVVADGTDPDTDNQEANADADTDGNGIVLSEGFESGDDATDVPDLENVTRSNATTYRFQFDEAVSDTTLDASRFFVFDAAGNETSATSVARSAVAADEATVVVATFAALPTSGTGTPVDAFVADGAVRATDSTDDENNGFNRPDEVILTLPATGSTQPPAGITAKPDLQSITRDQNVVTENYSVTFTFDQALPVNLGNVAFDLYDENGVQFRVAGTSCASPGVQCGTNSITFSIDNSFGGLSNEQIDAAVTGGVEDLDDATELTADVTVTEAQAPITDA